MTPKEKAVELVDKFKPHVTTWDYYNDCPESQDVITEDAAKCAIIAVDEILELGLDQKISIGTPYNMKLIGGIEFWEQVKEEINKL